MAVSKNVVDCNTNYCNSLADSFIIYWFEHPPQPEPNLHPKYFVTISVMLNQICLTR